MAACISFGLLGTLEAKDGSRDIVISSQRLRVLLATLLARANSSVPMDELAELVWDGRPPAHAGVTLRSYVKRLRRVLGVELGAHIVTRPPGYLAQVADDELDCLRFETLCRRGGAAVRRQQWNDASQVLTAALALWRDTPFIDTPSQALRDLHLPRLEEWRLQALEWRIEAELRLGNAASQIMELRMLAAQHPMREHFQAQLMSALHLCGRQAEALAVYQDARSLLVREIGIEPGDELRRMQQQILAGRTRTAAGREGHLVEGVRARPRCPRPGQDPALLAR